MAQEELAQPMPRAQLILFAILARAHQIAQCFVRGIRDPHRCQIASTVATRQLFRIAAVRLDAIAWLGRRQRGRDHLTGHRQFRQLPIQTIASWARFVTGPQLFHRTQLPDHLANVFRLIGDRTERSDLTVIRLGDSN